MISICFKAKPQPQRREREKLIEFLRWDARVASESEPGTLRFEFFEDPEQPDWIFVYESYEDDAAFELHKKNEPYNTFEKEIKPGLEDFDPLFDGRKLLGRMERPEA